VAHDGRRGDDVMKDQKSILVVDDDSGIRQLLTYVLQAKGYAVSSAVDGVEGLQKALDERPGLVITDVQMPNMDGVDMLRAIQRDNSAQRIIVMTGYAVEDKIENVKASGIPLIEKPFEMATLLPLVAEAFCES